MKEGRGREGGKSDRTRGEDQLGAEGLEHDAALERHE